MNWLVVLQIPVMFVVLWLFTSSMSQSLRTLQNKRICLLIAHPDDEAMFFAPTLLWLTRPELGNRIVIICLSSGNADGLGSIRKAELEKSAVRLGLPSADSVAVLDDKNFPDSMTATWDAKLIAQVLGRFFAPNMAKMSPTAAPTAGIDAIITFDKAGVSGHPNHGSLYHGTAAFIRTLMQRHKGWESPVKLYTLTSVNIVRKYISLLDALVTMGACLARLRDKGDFPSPLFVVSGPGDLWKAQTAMTRAHKSQMRWFRWGWIGISRYMVVNDLNKEKIV